MALEDAVLEVIVKEGEECRKIVNQANFATCPPEMKRVYLFLINSSLASLTQKRVGAWHVIGGGGIGALLMACIEVFAKIKGLW